MNKKNHRLADMSITPPLETYKPPPEHVLDASVDYPFYLDDRIFTCHQDIYRGQVVGYSISHCDDRSAESDNSIVRADTQHGTIHRHYFDPTGRDIFAGTARRNEIPIPAKGWDTVDKHFNIDHDWIVGNSDNHQRRWEELWQRHVNE